jgi:prevent-host-death family protein
MSSLGKLTDLIRKTGDKLIIVNKHAEPQFAIMSITEYEKLVTGSSTVRGLSEEELLTKINRDIAVWKTDQEDRDIDIAADNFAKSVKDVEGTLSSDAKTETEEEEDRYYFEPVDEEGEEENMSF